MLKLSDFKVGDKVFVLQKNNGRNEPARIYESKVIKVGRKYVTILRYNHKFSREDNIFPLIQSKDVGEILYLYKEKSQAEDEIRREKLYISIRQNVRFLYKLSTKELEEINSKLCKAE